MTEIERLEERVAAVERAALDGDHDFEDLAQLASVVETVERIEDLLADLESRVADLEARTESVEGYVGSVESVNEGVERRAAAAVDATEALEARVEALEARSGSDGPGRPSRDGGGVDDESDAVSEYDGSAGHTGGVDVDERARAILDGNASGVETDSAPGPADTTGGAVPVASADTDGSTALADVDGSTVPVDDPAEPGGDDASDGFRETGDGNSGGAGSGPEGTVSVPDPPGVPLGGADTDEPAATEPGGDGRQDSRVAGVARATVADGRGEVAADQGPVGDRSGDDESGLLASLATRLR